MDELLEIGTDLIGFLSSANVESVAGSLPPNVVETLKNKASLFGNMSVPDILKKFSEMSPEDYFSLLGVGLQAEGEVSEEVIDG